MSRLHNKIFLKSFVISALLSMSFPALAQQAAAAPSPVTNSYDLLRYALLTVAGLLVFVILILSSAAGVTAKLLIKKQENKNGLTVIKSATVLLLILLSSFGSFAQENSPVTTAAANGSALPWDIYIFFSVIGLEIIIILFLVKIIYGFAEVNVQKVAASKPRISILKKITQPLPVEEESRLDLHHDYDGIRELDNNIPGWWKLAFFSTFTFALVYLYQMFGSGTMPGQLRELAMANESAEMQKAAYLQHAANNVDEKTVKMLGDDDVLAGQQLYNKNCVACHGDKGQGGVWPNFTDEYWLHKGSIQDIFYSIKYGWQEKGMKGWKEDFSPNQMAQLASFINSIKNTNVPGGKEKQGELFADTAAIAVAATAPVTSK